MRDPVDATVPALEVAGLTKRYGTLEALRGIDLTVPAGSFFGLLGPNGAGKSTLIHIVTGLTSPTAGTARVFGLDVVRDYRHSRRLTGLSPQEFNFDRFFSIFELLVYQAGYFGLPRRLSRPRVADLLQRFGLWDKRHEKITRLSGGMKRRMQIAKAMIHDPPLLILDEPTSGVDVETRRALWAYWRELNLLGKTIVLTTHYLEEATALCRTLAVMDRGRIVAAGSTQAVSDAVGGDLSRYFVQEGAHQPGGTTR